MNVNVDIGWNQGRLRKAMRRLDAFVVRRAKALDRADAAVFYTYQRILHRAVWTQELTRRYRTDHRYSLVSAP